MIKLRLRRMGAKKRPFYRIVAAEHSSPRDGRFIEVIGHYDPLTEPATIKVEVERAQYWLSVGAKPSETVETLLKKAGAMDAEKTYYPKKQKSDKPAEASAPVVEDEVEETPVDDAAETEAPAEEEVEA